MGDQVKDENLGIHIQNEGSLHAALKAHYALSQDGVEEEVKGYIIDIVRPGGELIEIQTKNIYALRKKLTELLDDYQVRLVYPIALRKWLVYLDPEDKSIIRRRKSPFKGTPLDIFKELVRIPHLLPHPNLSWELVMIEEEEHRCKDGRGGWRKKGVSVQDRHLLGIVETMVFKQGRELLNLLPTCLDLAFTNKDIAEGLGCSIHIAQKMTYTFRHAGYLELCGQRGRQHLYRRPTALATTKE